MHIMNIHGTLFCAYMSSEQNRRDIMVFYRFVFLLASSCGHNKYHLTVQV